MNSNSSRSSMSSYTNESFDFDEIVDIYTIVKTYDSKKSTLFQYIKENNPKIDNELLKMTLVLILIKHKKYNMYNNNEICYICDAIDEINEYMSCK